MPYFRVDIPCAHFDDAWINLVEYIHTHWNPEYRDLLREIDYSLEAKALSIFSIARRLVNSAETLALHITPEHIVRWDLVFVEASTLLFPMIELVGCARLGRLSDGTTPNSVRRLIAGLEWLRNPEDLPSGNSLNQVGLDTERMESLVRHMDVHLNVSPRIIDVIETRNYFLHGVISGGINHIPNLLNFELPMAIINESRVAMQAYWHQLLHDDGNQGWLINLSQAAIHPFIIQGSDIFDQGLLDPDIVISWLNS